MTDEQPLLEAGVGEDQIINMMLIMAMEPLPLNQMARLLKTADWLQRSLEELQRKMLSYGGIHLHYLKHLRN